MKDRKTMVPVLGEGGTLHLQAGLLSSEERARWSA
jgi:hypothetical protein